jgi:NADPH-dependent ferric siderophore reductase
MRLVINAPAPPMNAISASWHPEHIMSAVQHITRTGQFLTTVSNVTALSPRMRRIALSSPELARRGWPLAADIAIVLTGADGREVRRRYTVRSAAGDRLVVDAVLHGHGPGSAWASEVRPGDQVTFFGPRGEIGLPDAEWVLALTDESGLPAIAALCEAYQKPVRVLAEIADQDEHYPLPDAAAVQWLVRDGRPAGSAALLMDALDALDPGAGRGYAYVLGESRVIVALRDSLARYGLGRADVYAKGYWNLNSRPTR